jgi:hypothetical protein
LCRASTETGTVCACASWMAGTRSAMTGRVNIVSASQH